MNRQYLLLVDLLIDCWKDIILLVKYNGNAKCYVFILRKERIKEFLVGGKISMTIVRIEVFLL